ncbi:hypothetical protein [Burkholderia plantarii]|uniref:hypothetical protein n=1 Tax=Burkholderia plantarii TaxID=41899 RepID=UPI001F5BFD41|nr:hypothetical protein [Burkholderia plantarii]
MLNQFWATNSLNIAIRIKTNMNRGGFVRNFYVNGVTLPNGVSLTGAGYGSKLLAGSPSTPRCRSAWPARRPATRRPRRAA